MPSRSMPIERSNPSFGNAGPALRDFGSGALRTEGSADAMPHSRVLLIDDDFVTRQVAEAALGRAGFDVATFGDSRLALRWLADNAVDVIVTDIYMPDVDGLEVVLTARQSCPEVKVLAISGGGSLFGRDYLRIAERLGADATLGKPFRPAELQDAVEALLAGRVRTDEFADMSV